MARPEVRLLVLVLIAACSDDREVLPIDMPPRERPDEVEQETEPDAEEPSYREVAGPAGTLEGTVRWVGRRPPNPTLPVHMQHRVCGRNQHVPAVVVGRGGGVAHALVTIEGIEAGPRAIPDAPAVLDQVGCRYEPHVLAVMRGQPITFRNSDEVLHNVHAVWDDGDEWFSIGQPRRGMTATQTAERTGLVRIVCDAGHAWMLAWVHVLDHPYFATTDAEGRFRIEDVPPGAHTARVWHQGWEVVGEASGRPMFADPVLIERPIEVRAGETATLAVTIPP